jgi:hypothetical protein
MQIAGKEGQKSGAPARAGKVKSRHRNSLEETMPRKPTIEAARLILELYDQKFEKGEARVAALRQQK